jgi:hypothetical protein
MLDNICLRFDLKAWVVRRVSPSEKILIFCSAFTVRSRLRSVMSKPAEMVFPNSQDLPCGEKYAAVDDADGTVITEQLINSNNTMWYPVRRALRLSICK